VKNSGSDQDLEQADKHRVIVTVDVHSHMPSSVELAVLIAAARNISLHGLFVEDVDLLSVAQLPFSQEVQLLGGQPRTLSSQRMQRSMDIFASEFRQLLARQADNSSLVWSYGSVPGRKDLAALGQSIDAEYLILGQRARGALPEATLQRIVLVVGHSPLLLPALETILSRHPQRTTELLILGTSEQPSGETVPGLTDLLARHPQVTAIAVSQDRLPGILGVRAPAVNYVITSRADEHLPHILEAASCPVVLVA
jgi:hypothetical protein